MLKLRILTACILLPLAILGIFYLSAPVFMGVTAIIFSAAAWEWTRLSGLTAVKSRALAWAFLVIVGGSLKCLPFGVVSEVAVITWTVIFFFLLLYPRFKAYFMKVEVALLCGLLTLAPAWLSLNELQASLSYGPFWVLLVLGWIWAADIGAYFAGRRFGKHRLAPEISPGKTWEGLAGGALAVILVTVLVKFYFPSFHISLLNGLALSLLALLSSVVGDLWESLFKRNQNLKDSGRLLPGHGGVMDRLDSLMAAVPCVVFALQYI
jgi:phosphatidate cytidylyltransferase